VRVVERALLREYRGLLDALLARLDEQMVDTIVEIAKLPDVIRGYEDVKLASVERYHERLAELLDVVERPTATA
jgi:indolepyruvate ferredoxin oxidoreductase